MPPAWGQGEPIAVADDDEVTISLAEFDALRSEINNRTTLAYGLIALQLAALGAGLSVIDKLPDVLLALAGVSAFLWLFWVDHAGQVYKIAGYLGIVLAPRLAGLVKAKVLGWEEFVRQMEHPETSHGALFSGTGAPVFIQRATSADWYTAALFGLTPPGLAAGYLATLRHLHRPLAAHVWVEVGVVSVLWLMALWRFLAFKRTVNNIGQAILAAGNAAKSGHGPARG